MIKQISLFKLEGYGSGETDFMVQLVRSGVQAGNEFADNIIQPLLDTLNSPDQCAVLTITGHSDRVDTPGLTREQRRLEELSASTTRADNAAEAVELTIRSNFLGQLPDVFEEVQQVAIFSRAAGAAVLNISTDVLSEDERKQNRRVQMRLVRFLPD